MTPPLTPGEVDRLLTQHHVDTDDADRRERIHRLTVGFHRALDQVVRDEARKALDVSKEHWNCRCDTTYVTYEQALELHYKWLRGEHVPWRNCGCPPCIALRTQADGAE